MSYRKNLGLEKDGQDWTYLGSVDPLWAVYTDPQRRFGKWNIEEFFHSGEQEIERVMEIAARLGYPAGRERALDFGCGVGRLTRTLAKHFDESIGIDISHSMIAKAEELNQSVPNCKFILNTAPNLTIFPNNSFDMIYTGVVLQHIRSKSVIKSYISEFIRVLRERGLLVFQLPSYLPLRNRIQPRRRLFALLAALGLNKDFLYNKLGLYPIRMNFIPENKMITFLDSYRTKVLKVEEDLRAGDLNQSRTYYVTL